MELKFLGRGAAFNPKEGNTSAYFIENNELFLIDSGETVFQSLIDNKILDNVDNIYVMITHTHSDHIGSIGSLASYAFYVLNKKLNIIIPNNPKKEKYLNYIEYSLEAFGCKNKYQFINEENFDNKYNSFNNIRFKETFHTINLDCYGLLFSTDKGYVYYSGDSRELSNVEELINNNEEIYKLYIDTTTAVVEDNPHLHIDILYDKIPDNIKRKVYCMHVNNAECIDKAKSLGFNVVETK